MANFRTCRGRQSLSSDASHRTNSWHCCEDRPPARPAAARTIQHSFSTSGTRDTVAREGRPPRPGGAAVTVARRRPSASSGGEEEEEEEEEARELPRRPPAAGGRRGTACL
ncbi:unnamed protein product [Prorocentrum cordatum]|uniref:Uncharacterized protein n=1 Tax=Prorocentrum cordatum TaxID=2364126 RepID=A0ABN9TQR0_9DINO|nr:unnamed protein product [Polarella glacialis]